MESMQHCNQNILRDLLHIVLASCDEKSRTEHQRSHKSFNHFLKQKYNNVLQRNPGLLSLLVILSYPAGSHTNDIYVREQFETFLASEGETDFKKVYPLFSGGWAECCGSVFSTHTLSHNRDDIDIMVCIKDYNLLNIPDLDDIVMEFQVTLPVYVSLFVVKKNSNKTPLENRFFHDHFKLQEVLHLPLGNFVTKLLQHVAELPQEIHGPAYTSTIPETNVLKSTQSKLYCLQDLIYCIELKPHVVYDILQKWASRERVSGWPTEELICTVKTSPCHAVPVGPKLYGGKGWRLSFSFAETFLIKNCGYAKKLIYVCGKVLLKQFTNIPSYMLKTCFLWMMEDVPSRVWSEPKTTELVIALIKRLVVCYASQCLPHYFLPAHNLFDDVPYCLIKVQQRQLMCCLSNMEKAIMTSTWLSKFMSEETFREIEELRRIRSDGQAYLLCWHIINEAITASLGQVFYFLENLDPKASKDHTIRLLTIPIEIIHLSIALIHECLEIFGGFELPVGRTFVAICDRVFHYMMSLQVSDPLLSIREDTVLLTTIFQKFLDKARNFIAKTVDSSDICSGQVITYMQLQTIEMGKVCLQQSARLTEQEKLPVLEWIDLDKMSSVQICNLYTVVASSHNKYAKVNEEKQNTFVDILLSDLQLHFSAYTMGKTLCDSDPLRKNPTVRCVCESPKKCLPNKLRARYVSLYLKVLSVCLFLREKIFQKESRSVIQDTKLKVSPEEFMIFRRYQKYLFSFSRAIQNVFDKTSLSSQFISINTLYLLDSMLDAALMLEICKPVPVKRDVKTKLTL